MARPRVFISSTYYDLKVVRSDVDLALAQLCFDSVLNERGRIPYEKTKQLEHSCYREINNCDIVVAIIGGRLGSTSATDDQNSISQMGLRTAIDLDKQLFVFVDRNVLSEFGTWSKNRDVSVKWTFTEDVKIFEFLKFVHELPRNNPIHAFETAGDITSFLREQFAGLFQRLLSEHEVKLELNLSSQLKATAELLNAAVEKATAAPSGNLPELIFANQPLFQELRKVLGVPYRVFFTTRSELDTLLKVRSFNTVNEDEWDSSDHIEWLRKHSTDSDVDILKVARSFFDDDGNVNYVPRSAWESNMVTLTLNYQSTLDDDDLEIPF